MDAGSPAQLDAPKKTYVPTWIKVCCDLPDKAEVLSMARALQVPRATVVGSLISVWAWFNRHTTDGTSRLLTLDDVDTFAELPGFAQAMEGVGWLVHDAQAAELALPNFHRHSFRTEKDRLAKGKERSRRYRARQKTRPAAMTHHASRHVSESAPSPAREENSSLRPARTCSVGAAESIATLDRLLHGGRPGIQTAATPAALCSTGPLRRENEHDHQDDGRS